MPTPDVHIAVLETKVEQIQSDLAQVKTDVRQLLTQSNHMTGLAHAVKIASVCVTVLTPAGVALVRWLSTHGLL